MEMATLIIPCVLDVTESFSAPREVKHLLVSENLQQETQII